MYTKVVLTIADRPGAESRFGWRDSFHTDGFADVKDRLAREFKIFVPKRPRGVYVDGAGGRPKQVGVLMSQWLPEMMIDRNLWCTTWVTFHNLTEELPKEFRAKP